MDRLPTDVLREILDYLDPETDDFSSNFWVNARRRYKPRDDHERALSDIASFRLACKRFRELGAPYLFRCVVQRFSHKSFQKLNSLAESPELARYVRKFVYLMPYLYVEGTKSLEDFFRDHDTTRLPYPRRLIEHSKEIQGVLREQELIIQSSYDVKVLKKAMQAFSSLQSVHILRSVGSLETTHDRMALSTRAESWDYVYCCWVPACKRAIETVFEALDYGKPPIESIRCPGLSPQSILELPCKVQNKSLAEICRNLTYLDLHFDDRMYMSWVPSPESNVPASSELFKQIFSASTRLERIYLGFSASHPPSFSLESIFHGITWSNLHLFAIESWILSAAEIIHFVKRHSSSLRGIRLGNIQLKEPDRWVRDVVLPLRSIFSVSTHDLEWFSLEGSGYEVEFASNSNFDTEAVNLALGIEGPDSSDEEGEEDPVQDNQHGINGIGQATNGNGNSSNHAPDSSVEEHQYQSEADVHLLAELLMMEDTGGRVTQEQRKAWERLMLGRSMPLGRNI